MISEKKILAYTLKNAVENKGSARALNVLSGLFAEGLKKEGIKEIMLKLNSVVKKVNSMSLEEQEKEFERLRDLVGHRVEREGLEELPNVSKKGIIMRFAPAPSGPLHVGHIISNMISSLYVKKYGGKFYVRIEDTNPEQISLDAYKSIKEDCDWIFGNVADYIIQSDRMELYYSYAVSLIEKNKAYVCICSQEQFKSFSEKKKDCPCRKKSVQENILGWEKMINKKGFKEGEAVLRFKSSMQDPNPAMRDFPLARINLTKHPRQGKKYRVWPLMNLAVPVDDIELKMTHIIRGKDHMDNAKRQKMFYSAFGFEKIFPWISFIGRIKFTDLALSKRKITAAIEAGEFENWEDERLPTIASLRKRGYKPEAFAKFVEQRGLTEVDKVMNSKDFFKIIDGFNRN